jgi:hypothetical protein
MTRKDDLGNENPTIVWIKRNWGVVLILFSILALYVRVANAIKISEEQPNINKLLSDNIIVLTTNQKLVMDDVKGLKQLHFK